MTVYLARDIPAFLMYCVDGESVSSLLIESIDSMIQLVPRKQMREHCENAQSISDNPDEVDNCACICKLNTICRYYVRFRP